MLTSTIFNWGLPLLITSGASVGAVKASKESVKKDLGFFENAKKTIQYAGLGACGGAFTFMGLHLGAYCIKTTMNAMAETVNCISKESADPCSRDSIYQNCMILLPTVVLVVSVAAKRFNLGQNAVKVDAV